MAIKEEGGDSEECIHTDMCGCAVSTYIIVIVASVVVLKQNWDQIILDNDLIQCVGEWTFDVHILTQEFGKHLVVTINSFSLFQVKKEIEAQVHKTWVFTIR